MKNFVTVLLALFAFAPVAFAAKKMLTDIKLEWRGTSDMKEFKQMDLSRISKNKFQIEEFKDNRKEPRNKVGENREDADILPVETNSSIPAFVTDGVKRVFQEAGLEVVGSGAAYTLSGEINDFFVTETNTYQGKLAMKLVLKKNGKPVWQKIITGKNSRFGRSYKLDNYLESLSDSIIDVSQTMLENDEFRAQF